MELTCVSCICSNGNKLAETDTATGSGEVPVNQTPTLNETTTAAQSTLGRTLAWEPHVASMESALKKSHNVP
ncbi:unnamed protein product [Brassica rapa subsp. narinosa]|uniref:(rape) hypothetical protein n=1 Tax=Brassica napus TaxID=3708 RepID=A0A816Y0L0_BRANA|nr:unnamed protein product [Brassica napus]